MVLKDGFKLLIDLEEKHPHEELSYVFPGAKKSRQGKCQLCKAECEGRVFDVEDEKHCYLDFYKRERNYLENSQFHCAMHGFLYHKIVPDCAKYKGHLPSSLEPKRWNE